MATEATLEGFLADVKKVYDKETKTVTYRKTLDKGYWKDAPISKDQYKDYTEYEESYVKQGIAAMKDAHEADDVVKGTLYMSLPGKRTMSVRTNTDAVMRNPSTGEVTNGVTARVAVKVSKSVYTNELKSLIAELEK